ncbi:unnamed protein product, partial [Heterosigma akashiwo]
WLCSSWGGAASRRPGGFEAAGGVWAGAAALPLSAARAFGRSGPSPGGLMALRRRLGCGWGRWPRPLSGAPAVGRSTCPLFEWLDADGLASTAKRVRVGVWQSRRAANQRQPGGRQ